MRVFWLVVPLMVGCTAADELAVEEQDLEVSWRGEFESTDGCSNGEIELDLQPDGDGWFTGEYWFRATEDLFHEGRHVQALYEVEGEIVDGRVELSQVATVEADVLHNAQWCSGQFGLSFDPRFGDVLAGWWVPSDCDCTGNMTLGRDEG
jgi:hypothetical protein